MKKLSSTLIVVLLVMGIFAQTPEKISYQATVRNSANALVINQSVGMQISILQGSATGTAVYTETHNATTNANGLISIEIGAGTVVIGNFSNIDWANDSYFIKTETDPTGGTNYTITGVSQILSVPFALHAKTAESITGDIVETDPVYSTSHASNISSSDITNLSNLSGRNTGDQDISGIAINTQAIQDTASKIRADIPKIKTYSVGDYAKGGIVFWVDETKQHGLVCAKHDQAFEIGWWTASNLKNTFARGSGIYAGKTNTLLIILSAVTSGGVEHQFAARVCNELQVNQDGIIYGDWYLPSYEELRIMCQNKEIINTTAIANGGHLLSDAHYWSSTENDLYEVKGCYFADCSLAYLGKTDSFFVRAIRSF